jgi:hypothetical protein
MNMVDYCSNQTRRVDSLNSDKADPFWLDRTRYFTEILSRFAVRLSSEKATVLFRRFCALAASKNWHDWWLFESLDQILERSFAAISPPARSNVALDILNLPLPGEQFDDPMDRYWPELSRHLLRIKMVRPVSDFRWNARIKALIDASRCGGSLRERATIRLCHLSLAGLLENDENHMFAEALWLRRDTEYSLPSTTTLYEDLFLALPVPAGVSAEALFRQKYFSSERLPVVSDTYLITMARAARGTPHNRHKCLPDPAEALHLLGKLLQWNPLLEREYESDPLLTRNTSDAMGGAVGQSILGALSPSDFNAELGKQVLTWIDSNVTRSGLEALPYLIHLRPDLTSNAVRLLRRGLLSREYYQVESATTAIGNWLAVHEQKAVPFPDELVRVVVNIVTSRRFPSLYAVIKVTTQLFEASLLREEEQQRLVEGLSDLYHEVDYKVWQPNHPETHTLSDLRKACVRLAKQLQATGHKDNILLDWQRAAEQDPMPEIRWAFTDS